jgi:outer membrane protein TolC
MKRIGLLMGVILGIASAGLAQTTTGAGGEAAPRASTIDASLPAITLAQALDEAAASGFDLKIIGQTLNVAREQRSLDLAKQGLSLSASGAYAVADAFGQASDAIGIPPNVTDNKAQQAVNARADSAASGGLVSSSYQEALGHSFQGGLALSTPLTKLSLSASHSIPPSIPANTSFASTSLSLTMSQTLWDGYKGGQYLGGLEKSAISLQGKELTATQTTSAARARVKQAYIAMLAAQRDLSVKRQNLDKFQKVLAQTKAIFDLKQATAIDLKTAQINARSAEIDVATSDKVLRLANERLAVMLGRQSSARFVVADIPDPSYPAASVDEAIRIGLSKRVELTQFAISARSSRIDAALARAQSQPVVSLTGGAGFAASWAGQPVTAEALSLGAKVALPVVDSGTAELQAQTSEGQAALYDLQAQQMKRTIASDIRDFWETGLLNKEGIDLARQKAELAEAQFELVKAQNQYGAATTQDVLTASVTAATAEVNYATARNLYLQTELSLETAMGL